MPNSAACVGVRPKRLDIFILKSFLLLLAGTFFICLFILIMNILWRYVEDLVGKGLSVGVITKFFYYSALTLVPTALPLAVLLASLITFGNFGENYELIAMKTAGISLLRVMRPLTILCVIMAGVSFYFQNYTVPNATKHLYSLAYSMQQKSPELDIPEGEFYDRISGYNLYVKKKDSGTGMLYGVTIYDLSHGFDDIHVIVADSGKLATTADQKHLYLHLYSGEQFENLQKQQFDRSDVPYRRESFMEKHLLIKFNSGFDLVDAELMSSQAGSKNMSQIKHSIDSLSARQDQQGLGNLDSYKSSGLGTYKLSKEDSARLGASLLTYINIDSLYLTSTRTEQLDYRKKALDKISSQQSEFSLKSINMFNTDRVIRKHWIEWMKKISLSISILIFFFIGAPLGAIIRKGGLGVPVIVSVLTFILFYITSISGEKMFREGEWNMMGCWLSTIILFPLSAFFTIQANRDSTVFQWDAYKEFFRYWFGGRTRRNIQCKEVIIEEPDAVGCANMLGDLLAQIDVYRKETRWTVKHPNYYTLFFKDYVNESLANVSSYLEWVVNELGNSRNAVILDLINQMPVLKVFGMSAPFKSKIVNRIIGILLPLGVLFRIRALLFEKYVISSLDTIQKVSGRLIEYLQTGKITQ